MKIKTLLSLCCLVAVAWAADIEEISKLSAGLVSLVTIPIISVPEKADEFGKIEKTALSNLKLRMPRPFQVATDQKCNGKFVFTIAGENSDDVIKNMTCLSGIHMNVLTARLIPQRWPSKFPPSVDPAVAKRLSGKLNLTDRKALYRKWLQTSIFDKLPEPWKGDPWKNSNKLYSRVSSDGFLHVDQDLRGILLIDNQSARNLHLTHQKIAEPLLLAIQKFEEPLKQPRKDAEPHKEPSKAVPKEREVATVQADGMPFTFKDAKGVERKYLIKGIPMGLLVKSKKKSGWGVDGTQGSPFHDDLQANWILQILQADAGGKPTVAPPLTIDALTPYLIYRYGFYQGGQYRKFGPVEIARFFGLTES